MENGRMRVFFKAGSTYCSIHGKDEGIRLLLHKLIALEAQRMGVQTLDSRGNTFMITTFLIDDDQMSF